MSDFLWQLKAAWGNGFPIFNRFQELPPCPQGRRGSLVILPQMECKESRCILSFSTVKPQVIDMTTLNHGPSSYGFYSQCFAPQHVSMNTPMLSLSHIIFTILYKLYTSYIYSFLALFYIPHTFRYYTKFLHL